MMHRLTIWTTSLLLLIAIGCSEKVKDWNVNIDETNSYNDFPGPLQALRPELTGLFSHASFYFEKFTAPQIEVYSSEFKPNPLCHYIKKENKIFIATHLLEKPTSTLLTEISKAITREYIPSNHETTLIDAIIYEGKLLLSAKAFNPKLTEQQILEYSESEYNLALENEKNIWDYFDKQQFLYSPNPQLKERFLEDKAPVFHSQLDNLPFEVGKFIGLQITNAYYNQNRKTEFLDFLQLGTQEILNQSYYTKEKEQ